MGVTYETILKRMRDEYTLRTGWSPDDASDIGIRLKLVAGELYTYIQKLDQAKIDLSVLTATGTALSNLAKERGLSRYTAEYAVGQLYFSRSTSLTTSVTIPKDTVCAVSEKNPVRYITTSAATLPAGSTGVMVDARAQILGKAGNVDAMKIQVMLNPPPSIEMVRNLSAFTGGQDAETDEILRKRLLEAWKVFPNGSNAEFYRQCALEIEDVGSVGVIPRLNGAGTVGVYIVRKDNTVADSTLIERVRAHIDAKREVNVSVTVAAATQVLCSLSFALQPVPGITQTEVADLCAATIAEVFSKYKIGQNMRVRDMDVELLKIPQLEKYNINRLLYSDVTISQKHIARKGNIAFTAL